MSLPRHSSLFRNELTDYPSLHRLASYGLGVVGRELCGSIYDLPSPFCLRRRARNNPRLQRVLHECIRIFPELQKRRMIDVNHVASFVERDL